MGSERFDELTKTLATGTSRRVMLKAVAGVAAGGLLALFGQRSAEAVPKKKPHCVHEGESCGAAPCCGNLVCDAVTSVCIKVKKKK